MAKELTNPQNELLTRRVVELEEELFKTKERMIALLESTVKEKESRQSAEKPVDYNSPDFDVILNKQMEEASVVKGVISQVYYGRVVSIHLMGSGSIEIKQQSHHLVQAQTKDNKYVPLRVNLSHETFFLILEAMKFAEEKFGLDRQGIFDKLTGGGEFRFREAITFL